MSSCGLEGYQKKLYHSFPLHGSGVLRHPIPGFIFYYFYYFSAAVPYFQLRSHGKTDGSVEDKLNGDILSFRKVA